MTSQWWGRGVDVDPAEFPEGNKALKDLCGPALYEDDEVPEITTVQVCKAIMNLSNGAPPWDTTDLPVSTFNSATKLPQMSISNNSYNTWWRKGLCYLFGKLG